VAILFRTRLNLKSGVRLCREIPLTRKAAMEAAVAGFVVGCLYFPNGNPQPGPKFEYKQA
jgi:exodeoxyribonuclease III